MRNMLQLYTDKVERDSQAWILLWLRLFSTMYGLDGDVTKEMSVESLWNSRLIPAFQNTDYPSTFFVRLYIACPSITFTSIN